MPEPITLNSFNLITSPVSSPNPTPIKLGKRSQIWEAKLYNNDQECARSTVRLTNIDRS